MAGTTATLDPELKIWAEGDPDLPEEFKELLIRMLTYHIENSTNPHFTRLLSELWHKCLNLPPDESSKSALTKLMQQEVEHGIINAKILAGLGVDKVDRPMDQYAFRIPIDTFCDLSYFHALGDRVGVYIGETWEGVPYQPLLDVALQLHKDELFHCTLGALRRCRHQARGHQDVGRLPQSSALHRQARLSGRSKSG